MEWKNLETIYATGKLISIFESPTRTLLKTHDRVSYLLDDLHLWENSKGTDLTRLIEHERDSLSKLLTPGSRN